MPGHHEGDLIMGSMASNSAVGTIVERTTGYLTLLHLPAGHAAAAVADAVIEQVSALPAWFARTLTWDRGSEIARHERITAATGSRSTSPTPTPPGSAAPTRTSTACSASTSPKAPTCTHTAAQLHAIAAELNDRPRKRLGFYTPREPR